MSFKIVLLPPDWDADWPDRMRAALPGVNVVACTTADEAAREIEDADAAYGSVPPDVFPRAGKLRWIAGARAGLGGAWFYPELVNSDVVVTGMHGSYNETLSAHIVAFVLGLSRRYDHYIPMQTQRVWDRSESRPPMLDLYEMTAMIVGVGGSGAEAGRLCAAFGMRVFGIDPRVKAAPPGFAALYTPAEMDAHLGEADFVINTTPETPATLRMFDARRFGLMKRGSYFINISRGTVVVTDDLVAALRSGQLAGAGIDAVDPEPLPPDHPLWTAPGVLITPHVGIYGAPYRERWLQRLIENCRRFDRGERLENVVDKQQWF
jgi:phosphoglycerate dehydrogenase-like enzyme